VSLTLFVATHVIILASDLSTRWLTPGLHRKNPALHYIPEDAEEGEFYVTLRSATMPCGILSFGSWLEPRYIFAAGQLD
jgi:hypothetical protein